MKNILLGFLILIYLFPVFAEKNRCNSQILGYKVVKNSTYPFYFDKERACFFAFFVKNPEPMVDLKGNGNLGDAIWYGYYKVSKPEKIYEFPKPEGTMWSSVCTIDAVSFLPMHGDKKRDVTVIGSCDRDTINYTVPFVFVIQGNKYILDEKVYSALDGCIALTIADVREYIKNPKKYYRILRDR